MRFRFLKILAVGLPFAGSAMAVTTVNYSVETKIGPSDTLLSNPLNRDNWTGDDLDNWKAQSQSGLIYLRNENGGDDTLTRTNDGSFSYSLSGATSFSVTIDARIDSFWEAGLSSSGGGPSLLLGGDFNNSNDFFVNFNGTRYSIDNNTATTGAVGGNIATLRLDYNVVNGTLDFIYNPGEVDEALILDDFALAISTTQLQNFDQLSTRADNKFSGAANWTITTIPEPSSAMLLGLGGGICLTMRHRRKHR